MTQQEILIKISQSPGILQRDIMIQFGSEHQMILQLLKKGCITRRRKDRTYELFATGEEL